MSKFFIVLVAAQAAASNILNLSPNIFRLFYFLLVFWGAVTSCISIHSVTSLILEHSTVCFLISDVSFMMPKFDEGYKNGRKLFIYLLVFSSRIKLDLVSNAVY